MAPLTRRRFVALAGGALALASGAIAIVRTGGYDVPAARRASLVSLTAWQYVVVQHLARRIAAPDRDDGTVPSADDVDVVGFVDGYVAHLPAAIRRDLQRAFAMLEHLAPFGAGFTSRFTRLEAGDQDKVLAALESSPVDLLRGAFDGLKALVFMGYYRDPRTWTIVAYDGPLVNRPDAGWTPRGARP